LNSSVLEEMRKSTWFNMTPLSITQWFISDLLRAPTW